jgi:hypothetical protein
MTHPRPRPHACAHAHTRIRPHARTHAHTCTRVQVRDGMANVQQGIMLLVQTVAEVTNRIGMHNTRSSQQLKGFLAGTPTTSQAQLPGNSSQAQLGGPGPAGGGLNLLLDGDSYHDHAGQAGQPGDGAPAPPAPSALPSASAFGGVPSAGPGESGGYGGARARAGSAADSGGYGGYGGPPSFPKGAAAVAPASAGGYRSGAFWGVNAWGVNA